MVDFIIDHLDPMGQGVSKRISPKKQSTITFIPKALPGEQGSARIIKSSKGVEFAELQTLTKTSIQRITPECEHYAQCSGCDYLHISYADELVYKKSALLFLLRSFNLADKDIELIAAPQRFGYRNRVQLHYRHKYIGLVDSNSDRILEVPNCRLLREELKPAFDNLYADKNWSAVHKGAEGKNKDGHCEISLRNGEASIEWDAPYASGGFTQVNEQMNDKLRQWLQNRFSAEKFTSVLDLFAGNGNLSDVLLTSSEVKRIMVDSYTEQRSASSDPQFVKQDLFADDALERFSHRSKLKKIDLLLLDPPRKGFPAVVEWVKRFKPEHIVYVSCNPATLARDLQSLVLNNKLKIRNVVLLDMFPGTRHFETVVILQS